ncbi:glycoside hydrolase [Clostridiisalibacter paucivorans]|uniref:glycoside hydrolase n=1 Tax=Clostridiisalibacter paucivorans TaxID=408753 RepID=UPI000479D02C|nr:glycoside hydrolase [Clostridiisalibacter paucivorans]
MKRHEFSPRKKDLKKVIRSIIQGIILIGLIWLIVVTLYPAKGYEHIDKEKYVQTKDGFIALSYFGVDRTGSETLISTNRLEKHLNALKDSGYVTITQQDILNYYNNDEKLPSKGLFLMFEDGRRDTAIFSQKILEKLNYKSTILTYAQNLEKKDPKFLDGDDLLDMDKGDFWEFGTNGYRLEFINVFDRYGKFLNRLNNKEFQRISPYLDRRYNHYLMDYIRDEYGVPMEDFKQMQQRIAYDYGQIDEVYTEIMGRVPILYTLMHANTGQFGTNDKVSNENEKWIYDLFKINFNREGNALNTNKASIYNLNRLQVQPYWYTNHLLMKIWDDTKQDVAFISGDMERKSYWDTLLGQSEFIKDTIILTSLPKDRGLMFLKNSNNYKDVNLSVELKGNKVGTQTIYLRADEGLKSYISVQLRDNIVYICEKIQGEKQRTLFSVDLNVHDGIDFQSKDENRLEAEIQELNTEIKYAEDAEEAKEKGILLKEKMKEKAQSIEDGNTAYIPEIEISEPGDRLFDINLMGNKINIYVDEKLLVENLQVDILGKGAVYLESSFSGYGYSQRNLSDDVYDGVFKNLVIKKAESQLSKDGDVLYDNRLSGMVKIKYSIKSKWESVLNWFIETL